MLWCLNWKNDLYCNCTTDDEEYLIIVDCVCEMKAHTKSADVEIPVYT